MARIINGLPLFLWPWRIVNTEYGQLKIQKCNLYYNKGTVCLSLCHTIPVI